jgi:hypothetical protein
MEERDDWKLGDDGEPVTCPHCGKSNRAGLAYCTICGTPFAEALEADPGSLRGLGEAMGGRPRPRRAAPQHSLRAWTISAALLLAIVVVLAWLQTREDPYLLEDLMDAIQATPLPPPEPDPTEAATRVPVPTRTPPPPPPPPSPIPAAVPAPPPVVATQTAEPPLPRPEPTARPVAAPTRRPAPPARPTEVPRPRRTQMPEVPTAAEDEATPGFPRVAATEKPSLGTDLQDATRRYRAAVDVHNSRVDEYNDLADEIQRRNAWDDSEASVELRRRLDRAREAVESARVEAEMLRTQMEAVRTRYR